MPDDTAFLTPERLATYHKVWSKEALASIEGNHVFDAPQVAEIAETMRHLFGPDFDPMPTLIILNQLKTSVILAGEAGIHSCESYQEYMLLFAQALMVAYPFVEEITDGEV